MRTNFYLNNKKASKTFLESLAGREAVKSWEEEAKRAYLRNTLSDLTRYTRWGFITIKFK